MQIAQLIDDVLKKEGGYVNHPADKGGPTKYGITQATLEDWRGLPVSPLDVQHLSKSEASDIYEARYYTDPGVPALPAILRPLVFDMCVNHGPRKAIQMLQDVVGRMSGKTIKQDGVIGPVTVAACNIAVNVYGQDVVRQLVSRRKAFYQAIVDDNPKQAVFLAGWLKRADSFLEA